MCIGIPMQVIRSEGHRALCRHGEESRGEEQSWVDMSLVGEQPADSWVLVFLEAARETLTPERAAQMLDALTAMQAVMTGDSADLDTLFADLVDREPQLPAHLQAQPSQSEQKTGTDSMPSPLINRLVDELGYPRLDQSNFDDFIKSAPFSVLFFTEQPKRFPESNDVAVILPELVKCFPQLTPAVIAPESEKTLQGRYNFTVWPALVFLKEGRYLGAITKVQDWDIYQAEISSILALEPRRDPGIGIPVVVNPVNSGCGQ